MQLAAWEAGKKLPTFTQSPKEKMQMAIQTAKAKDLAGAEARGGDIPTRTVATQNQQTVQAAKTIIPGIQDLIDGKHSYGIFDILPNDKADYMSATGKLMDQLLTIYNLPKTDKSLDLMANLVRRGEGETTKAYRKRLVGVENDILKRYQNARNAMENKRINPNLNDNASNLDMSKMSNAQLEQIAAGE